jgi:hypothetical protein
MTIRTDAKQGLPRPGLDAAREGRDVWGYVNEKTSINTTAALTDDTFYTDIPQGKRLVVTQAYMHLGTASDTVEVEFGVTSAAAGGGDFTAVTGMYQLETGTVASEAQPSFLRFDPPIAVTKDDGDCFTAQVTGNDASAELTLEYRGWLEDE